MERWPRFDKNRQFAYSSLTDSNPAAHAPLAYSRVGTMEIRLMFTRGGRLTFAPAAAQAMAIASPKPLLAPVTMTFCPLVSP